MHHCGSLCCIHDCMQQLFPSLLHIDEQLKSLLIIVTMISPVIMMSNLFKRQAPDSTVLTSTTAQPPLPCPTVDNNGSGCYPLSQCTEASTQSSNEGVHFVTTGFQLCGEDSVTKEPHVCCNKMPDTTTSPSSTTTNTPTSTTTTIPSGNTTTTPTVDCATIKTGFGTDEVRSLPNRQIVGGDDAGEYNYPYMAALFTQTDINRTTTRCGASIISRRSLLTAAHCFPKEDQYIKIVAVIGDYILRDSSHESNPIELERIILHPDFIEGQVYNDIAILVLTTALNFSESITPVCLPSKEQVNETFAGLNATVTGWGRDKYNGNSQATLQSAEIPVITQQECQNVYSDAPGVRDALPNGITIDIICAGLYNDTRRDSCKGDSGGPLVAPDQHGSHWIQIGVVSSGKPCGQRYPGFYTRTTQYLDWIATNIVP